MVLSARGQYTNAHGLAFFFIAISQSIKSLQANQTVSKYVYIIITIICCNLGFFSFIYMYTASSKRQNCSKLEPSASSILNVLLKFTVSQTDFNLAQVAQMAPDSLWSFDLAMTCLHGSLTHSTCNPPDGCLHYLKRMLYNTAAMKEEHGSTSRLLIHSACGRDEQIIDTVKKKQKKTSCLAHGWSAFR